MRDPKKSFRRSFHRNPEGDHEAITISEEILEELSGGITGAFDAIMKKGLDGFPE